MYPRQIELEHLGIELRLERKKLDVMFVLKTLQLMQILCMGNFIDVIGVQDNVR